MLKRKYEQKLISALETNKEFLIDNLRQEWEEAQKIIKRKERAERIVAMTKKSGAALGKIILGMTLVGGVLTVAMVAPKVFTVFGRPDKSGKRYKGFFNEQDFRKSIRQLKFKKYIKVVKKGKNEDSEIFEIYLEKKGNKKIVRESFKDLTIAKSARWDDVWRIVAFDIPERHKWAREGFREKLRQLDFYPLQESVFALPYDCRREIEFLCSVFNISDYVRYLETKILVFDDDLRDFYGIK
ncbi:MAG: hypothetical protein V3T98_00085 [Candidatus Paceibacterota bacterium]